jgi:glycerophosphoryl diester phosphodiesterase
MLIIGHRGAKGLAPENTKASFDAALQHSVDAVEFDVRTTQDNVPVIFHDQCIQTDKTKLSIIKNDYITLQQAFPDLLTLAEALDYLGNRIPVVIEVKPESNISPILKDIEHALRSGWIMNNIKRVLPDTRLIINEKWSGIRASRRARKLKTEYITMNRRWLWSGFIRAITKRDFKLTAYTVNNPKKAEKWTQAGIYAVVTDYPDRFKKI